MKYPVSVVLIVRNEEANIAACLAAVDWCEDILVYDQGSTDRTVALARERGARVFDSETRGICNPDRERGVTAAKNEWILVLEADERVTPELREQIIAVIKNPSVRHAGYEIAFRHYFLGHWIKSCGWHPSYIVRLVRKGKAFFPAGIHTNARLNGSCGHLDAPMIHLSYSSISQYFAKFERYTNRLAEEDAQRGKRIRGIGFLVEFVIRPAYHFCNKYLAKGGFRDGFRGFFIAFSAALTIYVANAKLWELTSACAAADHAKRRTDAPGNRS